MRFSPAAFALCLSLLTVAAVLAAEFPVSRDAAASASDSSASPSSGDAAAKHAKRTACLKEAKTKKLVGADKKAFLEHCIQAP